MNERPAKKFDRKRLREIVESYGGNLRIVRRSCGADSYEQALAAQSLEELDVYLLGVFHAGAQPGEGDEQELPALAAPARRMRAQPPRQECWRDSYQRIQTERTLGVLVQEGEVGGDQFMKMAERYLPEERTEALDAMVTIE